MTFITCDVVWILKHKTQGDSSFVDAKIYNLLVLFEWSACRSFLEFWEFCRNKECRKLYSRALDVLAREIGYYQRVLIEENQYKTCLTKCLTSCECGENLQYQYIIVYNNCEFMSYVWNFTYCIRKERVSRLQNFLVDA